MNERIFELIQTQNGFRGLLWTEEDKQEFAELIVRECAKVNYNSPFKDGEFHARELLEHFGVEE